MSSSDVMASPPRSTFETLPPEIVTMIAEHLLLRGGSLMSQDLGDFDDSKEGLEADIKQEDIRESFGSLNALARTCRYLYLTANPTLYKVVVIQSYVQLIFLFRTLTLNTALRCWVRTLVWMPKQLLPYTMPMGDELDNMDLDRVPQLDRAMDEIAAHWPVINTFDSRIADIFQIEGGNVMDEGIVAAILGMMSRITTLVLRVGSVVDDSFEVLPLYPVSADIFRLLDPWESGRGNFLPDLQRVVIEDNRHADFPGFGIPYGNQSVGAFFESCPTLRRLEYMAKSCKPANWGRIVPLGRYRVSTSVEEMVTPFGNMPMAELPRTFHSLPNLKVLRAEFRIHGDDRETTQDLSEINWHEFGSWNYTRAGLLSAANHLRELHLTTRPKSDWDYLNPHMHMPSPGYPELCRVLPKMQALEALTVEPIWLFDFADRTMPSRTATLLPPNISSLQMVDYWGVSVDDPLDDYYESCYLDFAHPSQVWGSIFESIYGACERNPLCRLRTITLTTPLWRIAEGMASGTDTSINGVPTHSRNVAMFFETWEERFGDLGLTLIIKEMPATHIPKQEWSVLE